MKDFTREQVARHLFNVMNEGRFGAAGSKITADGVWKWYIETGWDKIMVPGLRMVAR